MKRNHREIWLFLALGCIALSSIVSAADGKADGQFTVDGKPTKLVYAYAFAQEGFFDKNAQDILVLLSDVPLTGKSLTDEFERISLAKAGKLHCIEVVIDSKKQPVSVTLRHEAFKKPESGGSSDDVFEAKTFDGKIIDGRFYRKAPGKSFDDLPYTYDITFNAPIVKKGK